MSSSAEAIAGFAGLDGLCKAETWGMGVGKLLERPYRLEAGFYASAGYTALQAMHNSGFELGRVAEQAVVRWFGPFPRRYVLDPAHGLPFLSSSHMMEARPRDYPLISIKHTRDLQRYVVRDGQILVSCSGTIGNVALVTKDLDGWAVSQHAIRVTPRDPVDLGLLYCFLQSPLGQFLVKRNTSGSVVPSIYEADVASLPIPRLPLALRQELSGRISRVKALRVEANRLLDVAEQMIEEQMGLPSIREFELAREVQGHESPVIFTLDAIDGLSKKFSKCRQRIDVTHHDPAARKLQAYLMEKCGGRPLGSVSLRIWRSSLRQRNFVTENAFGVPLLTGKQLTLTRFGELRFLSKLHTRTSSKEVVADGYVLITCGGSVGKVMYVHRNISGYVVSEDVIRLLPNTSAIHPGYVFAFLDSAYGQMLLRAEEYGSVQKKLRDFQVAELPVPIPDDRGEAVHQVVGSAFGWRADALDAEEAALSLFSEAIKNGRQTTESHWGQ